MGSIPFAPSSLYSSSPAAQNANRSIRDLLLMGGEERARQAERSGQIWANTIGGVGQAVAGGLQAYGENKRAQAEQFKVSEQEHTAGSFVSDWLDQGDGDPMTLLQGLTRIKGPKEGPKMAETIIKFAGNSQENDPEKHLKTTASGIDLFLKQSPENQARLWPSFKGGLTPTIEKLKLPVELSDELTPDVIGQLGLAKDAMLGVFGSKAEPTLAQIEAESAARARGTASVKPPEAPKPESFDYRDMGDAVGVYNSKGELVRKDRKGVTPERDKDQKPPKPSTGAEKKVLQYFNRAKQATDDITPLEDEISAAGGMDQLRLQYGANWMQSQIQQQYRQAQRAFTEARLRKDSGAAVPNTEYENDAATYFAQPGDTAAVLEQKRKGRQAILNGLAFESGNAYSEYYGELPPKGAMAGKVDIQAAAAALRQKYGIQ